MSPSWPPKNGPPRPQRPPPKRKASNPPWAASLAARRRRVSSPAWWGWGEEGEGPPAITSLRRCPWGPAAIRSTWAIARWSRLRVWPAWAAWPARVTSIGEKRKSRAIFTSFSFRYTYVCTASSACYFFTIQHCFTCRILPASKSVSSCKTKIFGGLIL